MKLNKAKLAVTTLSVATVASVVGSIAGTVAWYQYNTRATAAYVGTSAKCSENLQIRIHDAGVVGYEDRQWGTDLISRDVNDYLQNITETLHAGTPEEVTVKMGSTFSPVTALSAANEGVKKDERIAKFKANPIRQHFAYDQWEDANVGDIVEVPLQLRLLDIDGSAPSGVYADKPIYLADLTLMQRAGDTKEDVSDALRVNLDAFQPAGEHEYSTWSKKGYEIDTEGYLDLSGDGEFDRALGYEWDDVSVQKYGKGTQTSYRIESDKNTVLNPMAIDDNSTLEADKAMPLGYTDENGLLNVTVKIWLEGWQRLNKDRDSAIAELVDLDSIRHEEGTVVFELDTNKFFELRNEAWEELAVSVGKSADFAEAATLDEDNIYRTPDGFFAYDETDPLNPEWKDVAFEERANAGAVTDTGYEFYLDTAVEPNVNVYLLDGAPLSNVEEVAFPGALLTADENETVYAADAQEVYRFNLLGWDAVPFSAVKPNVKELIAEPTDNATFQDSSDGKFYRYESKAGWGKVSALSAIDGDQREDLDDAVTDKLYETNDSKVVAYHDGWKKASIARFDTDAEALTASAGSKYAVSDESGSDVYYFNGVAADAPAALDVESSWILAKTGKLLNTEAADVLAYYNGKSYTLIGEALATLGEKKDFDAVNALGNDTVYVVKDSGDAIHYVYRDSDGKFAEVEDGTDDWTIAGTLAGGDLNIKHASVIKAFADKTEDTNAELLLADNGEILTAADAERFMRFDGAEWKDVGGITDVANAAEALYSITSPKASEIYRNVEDDELWVNDLSRAYEDVTLEETTSVWNAADYIGSQFNVGLRFVVDAL